MPGGSYFLYAASPKGIAGGPSFDNAEACSQYLITEHSICTVPWDDAGANLRFSVTYEAADEVAEKALMATLEERLKGLKFEF
jgi:LL-diaminopimelate aminotransferase